MGEMSKGWIFWTWKAGAMISMRYVVRSDLAVRKRGRVVLQSRAHWGLDTPRPVESTVPEHMRIESWTCSFTVTITSAPTR